MTKEELEKEAREYVSKYQGWGWTPHEGSAVYYAMLNSYIDSAEPREKRIEELEKENAELDCQKNRNKFCYSCANATERCFKNEIGCPCDKYKSWKDENAELKAGRDINVFTKQLTKAKEIIKKFLGFAEAFGYSPSMDKFIAEAEQFLKDSDMEK